MEVIGCQRMTADMLITNLATGYPQEMFDVHKLVVDFNKLSDEQTMDRLVKGGCPNAATAMSTVIADGRARASEPSKPPT